MSQIAVKELVTEICWLQKSIVPDKNLSPGMQAVMFLFFFFFRLLCFETAYSFEQQWTNDQHTVNQPHFPCRAHLLSGDPDQMKELDTNHLEWITHVPNSRPVVKGKQTKPNTITTFYCKIM